MQIAYDYNDFMEKQLQVGPKEATFARIFSFSSKTSRSTVKPHRLDGVWKLLIALQNCHGDLLNNCQSASSNKQVCDSANCICIIAPLDYGTATLRGNVFRERKFNFEIMPRLRIIVFYL